MVCISNTSLRPRLSHVHAQDYNDTSTGSQFMSSTCVSLNRLNV